MEWLSEKSFLDESNYKYSMNNESLGLRFPSIIYPIFPSNYDYMNNVIQLSTLTLNLPLPNDHVIMVIFLSRIIPNDHVR